MNDKNPNLFQALANSKLPCEHGAMMVHSLLGSGPPEAEKFIKELQTRLGKAAGESAYAEKLNQLDQLIKAIEEGPVRQAIFIELLQRAPDAPPQALVLLDDGTQVYSVIPDDKVIDNLNMGDRVVLDGKGRAILGTALSCLRVGEEAQFERSLDARHLEVSLRGGSERAIYFISQRLADKLAEGAVSPGATLIVNPRLSFAFDVVPAQDGLSHFRFLVKTPVPDVVVERDIGAPPKCIEEVSELIRMEMTEPELRRQYRLRRCVMKLLAGVSGSGKTLAVLAIHRLLYDIMSEVTGVPVEELPPRVFRFRPSQLYSMWVGESDKNMDRLFDEIELLAGELFVAPDGREYYLPVLAILEEVDGLARSRGQDAVFDRILTTALTRLDPTREDLKDKLIVFIATTNEAHMVDSAFIRRIGGSIESFKRLGRQAFKAVVRKHLRGLPFAQREEGHATDQLWEETVSDLTAWLFSQNGSETGLVELTYAGSATPVIKHRRDFLTGGLVDRAVQQAAHEASKSAYRQARNPGLTLEQLMRAFDDQIRGVVDQLREQNAGSYVDLPDGVRVASVRRLPQPSHLPVEFQRN